jgi:osmoprotectant transport system ATP-binding protein
MAPADAFVEDFVGTDRALKRLALLRVRDVGAPGPVSASNAQLPVVSADDALRDALAQMLAHGVQEAVVQGSGGAVTVRMIAAHLAREGRR